MCVCVDGREVVMLAFSSLPRSKSFFSINLAVGEPEDEEESGGVGEGAGAKSRDDYVHNNNDDDNNSNSNSNSNDSNSNSNYSNSNNAFTKKKERRRNTVRKAKVAFTLERREGRKETKGERCRWWYSNIGNVCSRDTQQQRSAHNGGLFAPASSMKRNTLSSLSLSRLQT